MSDEGFIVIQRKITGWKWWHNNTARGLWLYLLVNANWKSGYLGDGNEIKRGQVCRSLRTMADENEVNVKTIRYWLKKFEESGEIVVDRAHRYHVITIVNYGKYQDKPDDKGTITGTITGTNTGTITGTNTGTDRTKKQSNKNNKVSKRNKRKKADPKTDQTDPMTIKSVRKYAEEIGHPEFNAEKFCAKYKNLEDWKGKVRQWVATERNYPGPAQRSEVLPAYMTNKTYSIENDDHPKVDRDALMREMQGK